VITAVDTSVLLDVLGGDPEFGSRSRRALATARTDGALIVGEVVLAELSSAVGDRDALATVLDRLQIGFVASTAAVAVDAGGAWRSYRLAGGPRTRIVADFLVAAHAAHHADRLLTRDRGFYRAAFADLAILDPSV
jgi:hypothetical protein